MKRHALSFAALTLLSCLGLARQAHAQFSQGVTVEIGGVGEPNADPVRISADKCAQDFVFSLPSYTSPVQVLEVWTATGTSNNCNDPANRTVNANTPESVCWFVGELTGVSGEATFPESGEVAGAELFSAQGEECPAAEGTEYTIYFVPLPSSSGETSSQPPAPIDGAQQLSATFTLYTTPPSAPTGVKPRTGENTIGISWNAISGALPNTAYVAYFSTVGVEAGAQCTAEGLEAGGPAPEPGGGIYRSEVDGTSASLGNLADKEVEIGDYVAAAVATRDVAGNIGELSEVVCVQRIATDGFWDACQNDDECKDGFDKCSFAPGSAQGGLSFAVLLSLGLLLWVRRGRKS